MADTLLDTLLKLPSESSWGAGLPCFTVTPLAEKGACQAVSLSGIPGTALLSSISFLSQNQMALEDKDVPACFSESPGYEKHERGTLAILGKSWPIFPLGKGRPPIVTIRLADCLKPWLFTETLSSLKGSERVEGTASLGGRERRAVSSQHGATLGPCSREPALLRPELSQAPLSQGSRQLGPRMCYF